LMGRERMTWPRMRLSEVAQRVPWKRPGRKLLSCSESSVLLPRSLRRNFSLESRNQSARPAAASVTSHHTIIDGHHLQVRSEHAESLQCNGVLPTHRRSWQVPFPMSRRGQKAPSTLPTLYCIYTIHFIRLKRAIALYASVRWPSNKQREIE